MSRMDPRWRGAIALSALVGGLLPGVLLLGLWMLLYPRGASA